jgi:hypothetical protein
MIHYKVDRQTAVDLVAAYPHDPQDQLASIRDYFEANLADGWVLVTMTFTDGGNWYFAFVAHGRT